MLHDLTDVKDSFAQLTGSLTGVGLTAYPRIVPAFFVETYRIIAGRRTRDLPILRKKVPVFCLEEENRPRNSMSVMNSNEILSHPRVREYLKGLPEPRYLFIYKSYRELERLAAEEGWCLLANSATLRIMLTKRSFFNGMVRELALKEIPGGHVPFNEFFNHGYSHWVRVFGSSFVVKLPEITQGGGRGTFFIHSSKDYQKIQRLLESGFWRGTDIKMIALSKYVEGVPIGLALCLTSQGVLCSGIQRQLIDLPYCNHFSESGIFCGHSWGDLQWPSDVKEEIYNQSRLVGSFLTDKGYRGILGIDFLVGNQGDIYPLEINPRLTGVFPCLSQHHIERNIIPMEAIHILELMNIPYRIDLEALNRAYKRPLSGAHVILFRGYDKADIPERAQSTGIFGVDQASGALSFFGETIDLGDIKKATQFIATDIPYHFPTRDRGCPDPLFRLARLLFPHPVVNEDGRLLNGARITIESVYHQLFNR